MKRMDIFEDFDAKNRTEKDLARCTFVHSSDKKNRRGIEAEGLGATDNPVITCGIYTFFEDDAKEMFEGGDHDFYYIRLKPGSKILYTNSSRPMDYVIGNFDGQFRKEWGSIIKRTGMSGQEDIMRIFGGGPAWFDWKAKFHREIEEHLEKNGYAGIQEGGQIVITDLNSIQSIMIDGKEEGRIMVNSTKKFNGSR